MNNNELRFNSIIGLYFFYYNEIFYILKNVQSTHIKIRLEMENALLVQGIPAEISKDKVSAFVKMISIAFKGRIIQIIVTVSPHIVCDCFFNPTLCFHMSVFLIEEILSNKCKTLSHE